MPNKLTAPLDPKHNTVATCSSLVTGRGQPPSPLGAHREHHMRAAIALLRLWLAPAAPIPLAPYPYPLLVPHDR